MANQAHKLNPASTEHTRNLKVVQQKKENRPPLKALPPADEDTLQFLPIG